MAAGSRKAAARSMRSQPSLHKALSFWIAAARPKPGVCFPCQDVKTKGLD
jgi:hypothetical protein